MTTLITDKKTTSVANHLFADIMQEWSFPRIVHSYNGTEFKLKCMENLSQQLGIKKTFISLHHPQANEKTRAGPTDKHAAVSSFYGPVYEGGHRGNTPDQIILLVLIFKR